MSLVQKWFYISGAEMKQSYFEFLRTPLKAIEEMMACAKAHYDRLSKDK